MVIHLIPLILQPSPSPLPLLLKVSQTQIMELTGNHHVVFVLLHLDIHLLILQECHFILLHVKLFFHRLDLFFVGLLQIFVLAFHFPLYELLFSPNLSILGLNYLLHLGNFVLPLFLFLVPFQRVPLLFKR